MNIIERIRALLAPPSASVIAARELEEHKRQLLAAKKRFCWADKDVKFHSEQIDELTEYLARVK